jgi:unsaturated rhamnogalacturonyl hydrolase
MNSGNRLLLTLVIITFFSNVLSAQPEEEKLYFNRDYIKSVMKKVADWQLENLVYESGNGSGGMGTIRSTSWIRGALYSGILATYYTTGDRKYLNITREWAEMNNWKPGPSPRHADDQTVGQVYTELFLLEGGDLMIKEPLRGPIKGWSKSNNWSWSDALFMAPPAIARMYAATGDKKYLDLIEMMYWDTYEYLYDKEDKLFYRDERYKYSDKKGPLTENGKKVFWARGNAWVLGGLARTLEFIPQDYENRKKYEKLFKEMAQKILELQQIDGLWRPSLLDPWQFPEKETSSSSFFTYAFAWGINNGLLEKEKFLIPVKRAWIALVECVDCNGKLRWVQQVGHDPQHIKSTDTMEYGVGAFLMAAREIHKLEFIAETGKRYKEDSIF